MFASKRQRSVARLLDRWAISVLLEVGAIRECEERGWMRDRTDPHARKRAFDLARRHPPPSVSSQAASIAMAEALGSIGDTCPECPSSSEELDRGRWPIRRGRGSLGSIMRVRKMAYEMGGRFRWPRDPGAEGIGPRLRISRPCDPN